jgi:hypothetical protein
MLVQQPRTAAFGLRGYWGAHQEAYAAVRGISNYALVITRLVLWFQDAQLFWHPHQLWQRFGPHLLHHAPALDFDGKFGGPQAICLLCRPLTTSPSTSRSRCVAMSVFPRGLSHTIVAAQILMAVFGVYRLRRRAAPPEIHKGPFVVEPLVPVGTTFVSEHSRGGSPAKLHGQV